MDKNQSLLLQARVLFEELTPLRQDCGSICGAACCRSRDGEETGMLLFPGEEAFYSDAPAGALRPTALGTLLVCEGRCARSWRPLACRIFPLLPLVRGQEIRVALDARAAAVCPLCSQGIRALSADFVEAVRQCGRQLMEREETAKALIRLTQQQDELRALRRHFGMWRGAVERGMQ